MRRDSNEDHPIQQYFHDAVHESLHDRLGLKNLEDVEHYLARLLAKFLHNEAIFALRDAHGRRLRSIPEMLAEGDVRLNAPSFEREREVHRHIGDFLLFWSGLFPEFLEAAGAGGKGLIDAVRQGSESYAIVGSFDYAPYTEEAPTFRKLSHEFIGCQQSLRLVRASFAGFRLQGWRDGFEA